MVAKELLKIARNLIAMEFPSREALQKYLKDHPNAEKSNHKVVNYHPNGQKRTEADYDHEGKLQGKSSMFREDGSKESEHNYKDDVQDGTAHSWHPNGQKKHEVDFKNGVLHGERKTFNSDGKKIRHEYYHNGRPKGTPYS